MPQAHATEANFDGLVGPTHNYAGLAPGNLASAAHLGQAASPRAAALQGLAKMRRLAALGVPQAILPPHPKPDLALLRRLGFTGDDPAVLAAAHRDAPHLLAAACSASSMWTANAATIAASADTTDARLHLTPANLTAALHRSLEPDFTARLLRQAFPDDAHFAVHDPLPNHPTLGDEGAANHTRFAHSHDGPGVHLFVFGQPDDPAAPTPQHFAARQTLAASRAVARLNHLRPDRCVFAQQHPDAIDAGVFHHDVIGVGHRTTLLIHELALLDQPRALDELRDAVARVTGTTLNTIVVPAALLSLPQCVATYLFNSQLVDATGPGDAPTLVAPTQCLRDPATAAYIESLITQGDLASVEYVDVEQSMSNGGGPACLRLRVPLTPAEHAAVHPGLWATPDRLDALEACVQRHYPDRLTPADLADPALLRAAHDACDAIAIALDLPNLYPVQQAV